MKFLIKEKKDKRLVIIDGEDFYTYNEIQRKFQIPPAVFVRELVRNRKQFQDKKVDWISADLEKHIRVVKLSKMTSKINQKASGWNSQVIKSGEGINLV